MSAGHLLIVCAWCERVRTAGDRWEELDTAQIGPHETTHGICADCLAAETRAAAEPLPLAFR